MFARFRQDGVNAYTWTTNNALASIVPKSGAATRTLNWRWDGAQNQTRLESISGAQFYYDATIVCPPPAALRSR